MTSPTFRRLLALALVFGLAAMGVLVLWVHAPAEREADAIIIVSPGDSLSTIGRKVEAEGIVAHRGFFRLAALFASRPLKTGEYFIPAEMSIVDIARRMYIRRVIQHPVAIPEGLTVREIADLLKANPLLAGAMPKAAEGALMPETYYVERGSSRAALVKRMRAERSKTLARLWDGRAKDLPFSTQAEAVVLASIVQKEASSEEEMPRVAAVFINRLRQGVKLQADPTVIYAVTGGKRKLNRPLSRADLAKKNPFNTYVVRGLPPAPIAAPGRAAIAAVLNPPASNEMYFVSNGNGGHVFSTSLDEHKKNVAKLRAIEKQRRKYGAR